MPNRMKQLRDAFGAELHVDHAFRSNRAGKKYRDLQETLVSLVRDGEVTTISGRKRTSYFRLIVSTVERGESRVSVCSMKAGRLDGQIDSIVASLIYMHVNRVVIAQSREHELMIYNFLARIYELQLATDAAITMIFEPSVAITLDICLPTTGASANSAGVVGRRARPSAVSRDSRTRVIEELSIDPAFFDASFSGHQRRPAGDRRVCCLVISGRPQPWSWSASELEGLAMGS